MAEDIVNVSDQIVWGFEKLLAREAVMGSERRRAEDQFKNLSLMANIAHEAEDAIALFGPKIDIDVSEASQSFFQVAKTGYMGEFSHLMLTVAENFGDKLDDLCRDVPIAVVAVTYSIYQGRKLLHLSIKTGIVDNVTINPITVFDWDEVANSETDVLPVTAEQPEIEIVLLPAVQDKMGQWHKDYDADGVYVPISKILGIYRLHPTDTAEPKV